MVRTPYVDKNGIRKGAWSEEEDNKLKAYILRYGHWNWRQLPKFAGLDRCGKSCRLRWVNYLKPGLKRGNFTQEEEELVIRLHNQLGNKWSAIATRLPGRTDNEIKNFWHTHIKKSNKQNCEGTEPNAQPNQTNRFSGAQQNDQQSSEFYQPKVPQKEDFTRDSTPLADTPCTRNSVAFPGSPDDNSYNESPSLSSISMNLAAMELVAEDGITSMESLFVQPTDSFWTEPFFPDTSSSHRDNSAGLSQEFPNPYTWYTEDVTDIWDHFM